MAWHSTQASSAKCYVEEGLNPELSAQLANWVEADLKALTELLDLPHPEREVEIYCGRPIADGGQLRLSSGQAGKHVRPSEGPSRIEIGHTDPEQLRGYLRHELAHHVMDDAGYPEWLNEGLAEYSAFELAEKKTSVELHQLFHAGLVVAAWSEPLEVEDRFGEIHAFAPDVWVPSLPVLLEMTYADYQEQVISRAGSEDPEFHAISHLLVRVLMESAGKEGPQRFLRNVQSGQDSLQAYLEVCGHDSIRSIFVAMSENLRHAVESVPDWQEHMRDFAWSRCLYGKLSAQFKSGPQMAAALQAIPRGSRVRLFPLSHD